MGVTARSDKSPMPSDFHSAIEEIRRLRRQLEQTNIRWEQAISAREQLKRSMVGSIKALSTALGVVRDLASTLPEGGTGQTIVGVVDGVLGPKQND